MTHPEDQAPESGRVSEADAARLWERAAELQARALHQLEARTGRGRSADGQEGAGADATEEGLAFPEDGYALADVRKAAEEAGIHPDFMERALGELRNESREGAGPQGTMDRVADGLLGGPDGSIVVRRVVRGSGDAVLAALDRVLTGPGHDLLLVDMDGEHPLAGGALTFRVRAFSSVSTEDYAWRAAWLWAELLLVTLRPAPGRTSEDDEAWEVELQVPLRKGRRVNAWGSLFTGGVTGLVGGAMGAAAGFGAGSVLALPALAAGAALALGSVAGFGGGSWGGAALYRLGWRHGATEMEKRLEETLHQVALHLRTGGAFSLPSRRAPADGGADTLLGSMGLSP